MKECRLCASCCCMPPCASLIPLVPSPPLCPLKVDPKWLFFPHKGMFRSTWEQVSRFYGRKAGSFFGTPWPGVSICSLKSGPFDTFENYGWFWEHQASPWGHRWGTQWNYCWVWRYAGGACSDDRCIVKIRMGFLQRIPSPVQGYPCEHESQTFKCSWCRLPGWTLDWMNCVLTASVLAEEGMLAKLEAEVEKVRGPYEEPEDAWHVWPCIFFRVLTISLRWPDTNVTP